MKQQQQRYRGSNDSSSPMPCVCVCEYINCAHCSHTVDISNSNPIWLCRSSSSSSSNSRTTSAIHTVYVRLRLFDFHLPFIKHQKHTVSRSSSHNRNRYSNKISHDCVQIAQFHFPFSVYCASVLNSILLSRIDWIVTKRDNNNNWNHKNHGWNHKKGKRQ